MRIRCEDVGCEHYVFHRQIIPLKKQYKIVGMAGEDIKAGDFVALNSADGTFKKYKEV